VQLLGPWPMHGPDQVNVGPSIDVTLTGNHACPGHIHHTTSTVYSTTGSPRKPSSLTELLLRCICPTPHTTPLGTTPNTGLQLRTDRLLCMLKNQSLLQVQLQSVRSHIPLVSQNMRSRPALHTLKRQAVLQGQQQPARGPG
jgi:hypothetical protein